MMERNVWCAVCGVWLAASGAWAQANPEQVARVETGELREARASWWGFNADDSTKFLQAAIDSRVPKLIIDKMPSAWVATQLRGVGDQTIEFEKGAEIQAKPGAFTGAGDVLFTLRCVTNVTLVGYGAALRMRRADYDAPPYVHAEWRHALSILSCRNIEVRGLTLAESGGDGIYLGCVSGRLPDTDIRIVDVACDRNYRQGISVISAENLTIERTAMRGTAGTAPAAGIDFEPNGPGERLVNCVMRDCVTEGNQGDGFAFYLVNLHADSKPVGISLERCRSVGNREAVSLATGNTEKEAAKGEVAFSKCAFAGSASDAIVIRRKPAGGMAVAFRECEVSGAAAGNRGAADVVLQSERHDERAVGGIVFDRLVIRQPVEREWIAWRRGGRAAAVEEVSGSVEVHAPGGGVENVALTDEWAAQTFKAKAFPAVARCETPLGKMRVIDSAPGIAMKLSPVRIRHGGCYVFYAEKARKVTFLVRQSQVGKYAESSRPIRVAAIGADGREGGKAVAEMPMPKPGELTEAACDVPREGFYRMRVEVGPNAFAALAADVPVAIDLTQGEQGFLASEASLYVPVPEGARAFAVAADGGGGTENVGLEIRDPSGGLAWERGTIGDWEQFTAEGNVKDGIWECKAKRPTEGAFEDFSLDVLGVPAYLFLSRERYWTPGKDAL